MNKKEKFIEEINDLIGNNDIELSQEALEYFENLKNNKKTSTGEFTDNGRKIFKYMQQNYEKQANSFQSKNIAEGLGVTGRSVGSSMRKLIVDRYVEKVSQNPITYSLTELGMSYQLEK